MEQIARATFWGGWVEAKAFAVAVLAKYPKDGENDRRESELVVSKRIWHCP